MWTEDGQAPERCYLGRKSIIEDTEVRLLLICNSNTQLLKEQSFAATDAASSDEGSKRHRLSERNGSQWAQGTGCSNEPRTSTAIRINLLVS